MNIGWFFCGWTRLTAEGKYASDILDLCMRYGMVYRHWRSDPKTDQVFFEMTSYTAALFGRRCCEEGICVSFLRRGGLPHLIRQYRHRVGIFLGIVLGGAILLASSRVLWDIRISGNERMTVGQVRAELASSGFHVGIPLSELDVNSMALQIQLDSEQLSWVSINMSGTVAYVEIRERIATPENKPLQPANLVARCEGIIEGVEAYTGNPVVRIGQAVRAGELLVSGVYDSRAVGWRVTRAAGRVLARTEHAFSVEIPLVYEKKEYVGAPICQKTLIFFEKEIKLFKNSSILGASCDKINYVDTFAAGNGVSLPISVRTERYLCYEYRPDTRDHARAEALAYYELECRIAETLSDAMLLRKNITVTVTDDAYLLNCTVQCLEDIAEVREFSVCEG